jgi:hypothetical protein
VANAGLFLYRYMSGASCVELHTHEAINRTNLALNIETYKRISPKKDSS